KSGKNNRKEDRITLCWVWAEGSLPSCSSCVSCLVVRTDQAGNRKVRRQRAPVHIQRQGWY
ncbi:unnamed protein product, partial [Gulo gulo]